MGELDNIILENINNLVLLLDRDANVTYASPSVKRILGFEPSDVLGMGWYEKTRNNFMRGKEAQLKLRKQLNDTPGLHGLSLEREILDAKKHKRQFVWNTSPGPGDCIVGIGTDISVKKQEQLALEAAKLKLEQRQEEMEASIRYARRLQSSFLPEEEYLRTCINDAFIFHRSKDIVSGDFYWVYRNEEKVFVAVADCTGHGVPGAFISMVGNTILKDIIIRKGVYNPAKILTLLDQEIQFALEHPCKPNAIPDGMDIGLMVYDYGSDKVKFSGANRPMLLCRNGDVQEFKPNKIGIGYDSIHSRKIFETVTMKIKSGDMLYLFSDGYTDQFGGENVKKFNRARFRKLVQSIANLDCYKQKMVVEETFESWKGTQEQIDDVTVVGLLL